VKDIVNVVSPCSYYIQQTEPHALIRKKGADVLHKALLAAGFKVQPLVGDIGGGWNMSWYRDTFASDAFVKAAVKEIKEGSLEGLNFVRLSNSHGSFPLHCCTRRIVGVQCRSGAACGRITRLINRAGLMIPSRTLRWLARLPPNHPRDRS
jgi:hypothetical protein